MAQPSRMYEGLGVHDVYMVERVTRQLGNREDLVPVPPLYLTLFPYQAPDEIANLWQSSVPHLERLVKDGDFAKYQRYLMPTLCPPYVVRPQSFLLESSYSCALCSITCIYRLLLAFQLVVDMEQPTLMSYRTQSFLLGQFMYTVLTVPSLKFKSLDILTSWNILFSRMLSL